MRLEEKIESQTLSVKVNKKFASQFRKFCESHFVQIGKFTEYALAEMMEDYHFGLKAQGILSRDDLKPIPHKKYFKE